jgi:predicted CoA-binding protein
MNQTDERLRQILQSTRTIAMAGASVKAERPSNQVMKFLQAHDYRVIPINPGNAGQVLMGETIWPDAASIPPAEGPIEMLDIFRRAEDVPALLETALPALIPRGLRTVWMQLGVVSPEGAEMARAAGLDVVMDRCTKIEWLRLLR